MNASPNGDPTAVQLPEEVVISDRPVAPIHKVSRRFGRFATKQVIVALSFFLLAAGGAAAYFLASRTTELRQQASGYASCEGNVSHGQRSCRGLRQPAVCNNGALESLPACAETQVCRGGGCVAADSTTNPSNAPLATTTNPSGLPTAIAANPSGQPQANTINPSNVPGISCGTGMGLFDLRVANSSPCIWEGAPYFKCNDGFQNQNFACVPTSPALASPTVTEPNCRSGTGLFSDPVANSSACRWQGAPYFECQPGFTNRNFQCQPSSPGNIAQTTYKLLVDGSSVSCVPCNEGECAYTKTDCEAIAEKSRTANALRMCFAKDCISVTRRTQCLAGEYSDQQACVAANLTTYRLVGEGSASRCEVCANASECGYKQEECEILANQRRTRLGCFAADCMTLNYRLSCLPGEFTDQQACLNAQSAARPTPAPTTTYRVSDSRPFTCQACANPNECGYTLEACQQTAREWNSSFSCYTAPGCNLGTQRQQCLPNEFISQESCLASIPVDTSSSTNSCGTGLGLFTSQVANSQACSWNGAAYFRCQPGYVNRNNSCESNILTILECYSPTVNACQMFTNTTPACPVGSFTSQQSCQTVLNATGSTASGQGSLGGASLNGGN